MLLGLLLLTDMPTYRLLTSCYLMVSENTWLGPWVFTYQGYFLKVFQVSSSRERSYLVFFRFFHKKKIGFQYPKQPLKFMYIFIFWGKILGIQVSFNTPSLPNQACSGQIERTIGL